VPGRTGLMGLPWKSRILANRESREKVARRSCPSR
jgi:hypothetical protein